MTNFATFLFSKDLQLIARGFSQGHGESKGSAVAEAIDNAAGMAGVSASYGLLVAALLV